MIWTSSILLSGFYLVARKWGGFSSLPLPSFEFRYSRVPVIITTSLPLSRDLYYHCKPNYTGHKTDRAVMLLPHRNRLLLPLMLLSSQILALPPQPTISTNLTVPEYHCIPKPSLFAPCPDYYDCLQAIFQLPSPPGSGSFHNGPPDDVFRLPVRKKHGSCRVRVELVHEGSGRQSADWQVVVARGVRLGDVWVVGLFFRFDGVFIWCCGFSTFLLLMSSFVFPLSFCWGWERNDMISWMSHPSIYLTCLFDLGFESWYFACETDGNTDITARSYSCINTPMRAPENSGGWTLLGKQDRLVVLLEHTSGTGYGSDIQVGVGAGATGDVSGNGNGNNVMVLWWEFRCGMGWLGKGVSM